MIAELQGIEAAKLTATVIVASAAPDASGTLTVPLRNVQEILEKDKAVNLGRLVLRGSACVVRFGAVEAPSWRAPAAVHTATSPALDSTDTIRAHVAERLSGLLGVPLADLKLAFDESDATLLNTGVGSSSIAIQPTGGGDRMPVAVRLYQGDRILASGTVRVGVLVRRRVMVAAGPIERGTTLATEMVTTDEQWLPPSATPADASMLGQVIRGRVAAGQVVGQRDVEPPVVVKRGDVIAVDCTSGGFVVRTTARAMEAARDGDVITFQSLTSKHTFKARMNGPGRAVTVAPGRELE
jgi:flagella basal body P-ring formation protein FlgA